MLHFVLRFTHTLADTTSSAQHALGKGQWYGLALLWQLAQDDAPIPRRWAHWRAATCSSC